MMNNYEAEVIPGLESIAIRELHALDRPAIQALHQTRPGFIRFGLAGGAEQLSALRSATALYRIHSFAIPRPKALLGHQHFTRLLGILEEGIQRWPRGAVSLGIGAAGSESAVMRRLKRQLADALGLALAEDGKGDLYLRLLRPPDKKGWEVLVRATAQPLSKRAWRVANAPGALNATVAYAMIPFSLSARPVTAVNLCSGTSTILIEHALLRPADVLIAIDHDDRMLGAAIRNAQASQTARRIHHLKADAGQTPLPAGSADCIYADLPFGHHIGSREANVRLYPAVLAEGARLARRGALMTLLTHDIQLLRRCLVGSAWKIKSETVITLSGLHPRLFVLARKSSRI